MNKEKTDEYTPADSDCQKRLVRLLDSIRYNRYTLFAGIVWRPVTGDAGDSWFQAWRKYRTSWQTAWEVACVIYPLPNAIGEARADNATRTPPTTL